MSYININYIIINIWFSLTHKNACVNVLYSERQSEDGTNETWNKKASIMMGRKKWNSVLCRMNRNSTVQDQISKRGDKTVRTQQKHILWGVAYTVGTKQHTFFHKYHKSLADRKSRSVSYDRIECCSETEHGNETVCVAKRTQNTK